MAINYNFGAVCFMDIHSDYKFESFMSKKDISWKQTLRILLHINHPMVGYVLIGIP